MPYQYPSFIVEEKKVASPFLFINDKNDLIGTLTDGDIRRGLISGKKLTDKVGKFVTKNFHYIKGQIDVKKIKTLKSNGIKLLPVIDNNRKIVKAAFTACLNKKCDKKNINYVVAGLSKKILKDNFIKGVNYRKMLELLSFKHSKIRDMFYQDLGDDLCYMESRITDLVLNSLTKKHIPTLAIHDSFIVPISKSTELYNSMINAFNILGYTSLPNIKGYPRV